MNSLVQILYHCVATQKKKKFTLRNINLHYKRIGLFVVPIFKWMSLLNMFVFLSLRFSLCVRIFHISYQKRTAFRDLLFVEVMRMWSEEEKYSLNRVQERFFSHNIKRRFVHCKCFRKELKNAYLFMINSF